MTTMRVRHDARHYCYHHSRGVACSIHLERNAMKKYIEIVQNSGLDAALIEFESDMIELFKKHTKQHTATALKMGRTTFYGRVRKLGLTHLFPKKLKRNGGTTNG